MSLFDYDKHRFGQPIEDVTIFHDIIDARKLRSIMDGESAMFSPSTSRIIEFHKRKHLAESNVVKWICEDYDNRKDTDKRLLKALFLYLYRGTDPDFIPAEDDVDRVMEQLIQMVDDSPYAEDFRRMCRLNRWHSDVIGRLMFDEILSEAESLSQLLSESGASDGDGEASGDSSSGEGDESQESKPGEGDTSDGSGNQDGSDKGDSDKPGNNKQGDQSDGESNTDDGDGENSGKDSNEKGSASTNQARSDSQTLVNRAIERIRNFVDNTDISPDTSIAKALEAAEKLGDGEVNPLSKLGYSNIDTGSIADKMGRMRSIFDAEQATRIEFAPGATISLCHGNDLRNVIPNEIALLSDPSTEIMFDLKYLSRSLLQRKTEGATRGGKGPIIMCIDVSGSMDVKSLTWAMSLAGAVGYTAASQGRDVAFIYYSDTVPDVILLDYENQYTLDDLERSIDSVVYNQEIGTGNPHEYSAIPRMNEIGIQRSCQANGGCTDYGAAFTAARDLMELNQTWEKADLLFLTDGGDSRSASSKLIAEELQDNGVRIFGICLIDKDHGTGFTKQMERSLEYFDSYAYVEFGKDIKTDDVIKQVSNNL